MLVPPSPNVQLHEAIVPFVSCDASVKITEPPTAGAPGANAKSAVGASVTTTSRDTVS